MTPALQSVSFDAIDPVAVATFWAGILGREVIREQDGALVPGDETQIGLRFVVPETDARGGRRLHLHLTSSDREDQRRTIAAVLRQGGRQLDVGQEEDAQYVVLGDVEGNEMCVIDPGNRFLEGTGFLGEVTCDGSRELGQFWHEALGWPLVWDVDGETAVQSPQGGTKVSWGGPPVEPKHGRNRQRLDLVAEDLEGDVARLVSLGAVRLRDLDDGVELEDPDGNEFRVRTP